jgi:hypothetical protein
VIENIGLDISTSSTTETACAMVFCVNIVQHKKVKKATERAVRPAYCYAVVVNTDCQ